MLELKACTIIPGPYKRDSIFLVFQTRNPEMQSEFFKKMNHVMSNKIYVHQTVAFNHYCYVSARPRKVLEEGLAKTLKQKPGIRSCPVDRCACAKRVWWFQWDGPCILRHLDSLSPVGDAVWGDIMYCLVGGSESLGEPLMFSSL